MVKKTNKKRQTKARKKIYHDLDHLAGKWSTDEYQEFSNALAQQRRIQIQRF
ncbi:hypothetical protein L0222_11480 [bacterium]|nr:hypothetical protein [bacterium]MCI0606423.1 hypothetical protein [bacterium]